MQVVKDFIYARPRLFDVADSLVRRISPSADRRDGFFDAFSRAHGGNLSVIQIGANDGLRSDPIRRFIVRDRWRGILVEPLPMVFELLKHNYAYLGNRGLRFVNAAISSENQRALRLYSFTESFLASLSPGERLDALRKASVNRDHLERYVERGRRRGRFAQHGSLDSIIREIEVPSLTLDRLIAEHGAGLGDIDLLVIDAEGHEPAILSSIDLAVHRVEAIFFETAHLGSERSRVFQMLNDRSYEVTELAKDAVAIRRN